MVYVNRTGLNLILALAIISFFISMVLLIIVRQNDRDLGLSFGIPALIVSILFFTLYFTFYFIGKDKFTVIPYQQHELANIITSQPDIGYPAKELEDGWGIIYSRDHVFNSVEPKDPYFTGKMVAPSMLTMDGAKKAEQIKKSYLTRVNIPYLHYEDDLLNRELLPAPGQMFITP